MLYLYLKIRKNFSSDSYEKNMRTKMEEIMRIFNFQTDQAITILEDKISQMNESVNQADKRLSALKLQKDSKIKENTVKKKLHGEELPFEENSPNKKTVQGKKSEVNEKNAGADKENPIEIYTKKLGGENAAVVTSASAAEIKKEIIIDMAKKGASSDYIAKQVELPVGEVEFIISMNM